jgi:phospholipid/cholesterol/gamma-HCH transport system permease protein
MTSTRVTGEAVAAPAQAEARVYSGAAVITLSGEWRLDVVSPRFADVLDPTEAPRPISFETESLAAWDSSLLIFLLEARDHCEEHGVGFDTGGLPERISRLLDLARAVPDRVDESEPERAGRVERLGTAGLSLWDATMDAVTFTGQVTDSMIRLVLRRTRMRWREFWVVVQSNSSGALGIVTIIALLIGVIIAFLGVVVLKRFGAGYYVSYLVGYGMLREMGALMTGIIMAGRTGAAFAAELGSMKITEEIDAYTTLGVSPIDHLVMPRILGLFVMMPLLVIYADFVGIVGGMLVAVTLLDLSPTQFMGGLLSAVTLSDALLGVFKAGIFGVIIGISGCMKGMQTGSDAGAVGRSATNAVVMGITLIILANAVVDWLAALLQI